LNPIKVILIGGTSHAGKSSAAAVVAARLGWEARSTDYLARHPGRPWPVGERAVPPHVVEYYGDLTDQARMDSVLAHYRRLGPQIDDIVRSHLAPGAPGLVLEGSALLPERAAAHTGPGVAAVWITAEPDLVTRRLHSESGYARATAAGRKLIDAFLRRSLAFDRLFLAEAEAKGLIVIKVADGDSIADVADRVLALAA
jgi:2-phosphoglycerate kinase